MSYPSNPSYMSYPSDQSSIWDIRQRLEENFRRVESILLEIQDLEDPRAKIEAAAELRHHIALAQKTLESAARAEAVRAFEDAVLTALGEASSILRKKVIDKLNERHKSTQST